MSQLIIRWKVSQKLLSPWEQLIFGKLLAIDLLGPREKTLSYVKQVSNKPYRPSKNVSWFLFRSIKWEKIGKNLFFTGKIAFFFKKLCFRQPLKSWRNDLSFSIVMVTIASELIETVPWGLSHSIFRGRLGQNLFFTGKIAFFSKNCVSNNILGPKELFL